MTFNDSKSLADYKSFQEYPEPLLKFASICCVVFIVIGVTGNMTTIIALARYRKAHNATAIFIMNLSFCDLLYCCFDLPLSATTFWIGSWPFGTTACRVFPCTRFALSCVALLSVMAITINRYIMITYPQIYQMLYRTRNLASMVTLIWVFSFGAVLPSWFEVWGRFGMDTVTGLCSLVPDKNDNSPATLFFVIAFVIPCLTIIICYAKIYRVVRRIMKRLRSKNSDKIRRRSQKDNTSSISSTDISTNNESENHIELVMPEIHQTSRTLSVLSCFRMSAINGTIAQNNSDIQIPIDHEKRKISLRTRIFRKNLTKSRPTAKDRKLLTMITALIISFFICHLPLTVLKVIHEIQPHPVPFIISSILRYLTSCINPVIYVMMSYEFRKAYINVITFQPCKLWTPCKNLCNPWT